MPIEAGEGEVIIHDEEMIRLAYELSEILRLPIELALLQALKNELAYWQTNQPPNLEATTPRLATEQ